MALQSVIDTIESVPEALRGEYVARDGKFHLAVEGMVSKDRVDEFRNRNVALLQERDALKAQYDGVDVDKYKELTALEIKQRDKKLIDAGKVDELVEARVAAMRADNDKVVGLLTARDAASTKQLESLLIDSALKDAASKAGVAPTGIDDVVLRGRQVFRLTDGRATAYDGDKQSFGKDSEPLTVGEWVTGLSERAPHLFIANQGGGAPGRTQGQGSAANTVTRAQYEAADPMDRAALVKGKTLVD